MRRIYSFNVMDELVKGSEVYAVIFTRTRPMVENASTLPGRELARYIADDDVDWYASEEEPHETEG